MADRLIAKGKIAAKETSSGRVKRKKQPTQVQFNEDGHEIVRVKVYGGPFAAHVTWAWQQK